MGKPILSGKSGVYIITHKNTNKVYIGSSINIYSRFQYHRNKLKANKHVNCKLQNYCNKYGFDGFVFEAKELCEKEKLIEREQYWMDFYKSYSNKGFNISKSATFPYKDLTKEQIIKRQNNFAEKMGKMIYVYDNKYNVTSYKSISECSRKLKLNRSHVWMCCNLKEFNENFLISFKEEINETIDTYFNDYLKHLQKNLNTFHKNLSKTNYMKDNLIVNALKYEILNFDIAQQLNNTVKSIFVYHKLTKNLTTIDNIKDYNKYLYAPTYSILQSWLREKHNLLVEINFRTFGVSSGNGYFYMVERKNKDKSMNNYIGKDVWSGFETYEQALEAGLQVGLTIIITKNKKH